MDGKKGNIAYYLFFFVFVFSCQKEKPGPSIAENPDDLICPNSKILRTHAIQLRGVFTVKAETIVPKGDTPFPITLNADDVTILNSQSKEVLCRVLERRGVGAGTIPLRGEHGLPIVTIERGPGLKLKRGDVEFSIPPAAKAPELLTNLEHSLDRLLSTGLARAEEGK